MACKRCLNPKWEGPYPNCNDCVTCRTCYGSGLTLAKGIPVKCEKCAGKGWMKKETA